MGAVRMSPPRVCSGIRNTNINDERKSVANLRRVFLLLLWVPMVALGHFLSMFFFKADSLIYYLFFLAWPFINFYAAYKFCQKDGEIVVIRLVTFFIFESAALAIILFFFG